MRFDAAQHRTFTEKLDCRYLLCAPERPHRDSFLVIALHGYGQDPEGFLPLAARMAGDQIIAALAAPYPFITRWNGEPQVGYCWITPRQSASSVRLHHDMVRHVLHDAGRDFGIPPERSILLGFSQSVALNYRFAATYPNAIRGVIGVCGGVPSDWDTNPQYTRTDAALLHIARREDEFYPPAKAEKFGDLLGRYAADVEFHMLEGGHRMPSKAGGLVRAWLTRLLAKTPA